MRRENNTCYHFLLSRAKEALRQVTITKPRKRTEYAREFDQHTREREDCIIARELESCMWEHKITSKSVVLLDIVQRLSPTTRCCKTRM